MVEVAVTSDHALLFLNTSSCSQRSRKLNRFRYEAHWALEDGCKETVATAWNQYSHYDVGWGCVEKKLRACVQRVLRWSNNLKGPKPRHIKHLCDCLADMQGMEDAL